MKLLHFADLHLDAAFAWAGKAAVHRREVLRQVLRRILQMAAELRVDAVLCGGDLYEHDRVTPDTQAFLRSEFARLDPLPIFIAPGNHDWFGPRSVYAQVDWSPNVHVFTCEQLVPVTLSEGITLWGGAFCSPTMIRGFLDSFAVDRGGVHIALFHGSDQSWLTEQDEGKAPHAPFDADQVRRAGLHHALVGHYHQPRDAAMHTYPGNPEPLSFGEKGERGVVQVTAGSDGAISRCRHRVALTEFHALAVDLTGCTSRQDVRDRVATDLVGRRGVARVTLSGELTPDLDLHGLDWKELAAGLDGPLVVKWGDVKVGYDLGAIAGEPTVRGEFVREVLQSDLPEDRRRRILLTGLRALEDREDLEVA